ncbi:MAG: HAMP domain-containing histidine kinase [Bacteroidales bacterium]|nr:HAMP domain-containing histidine kinase [Bacteroidales bacterium]
MKNKSINIPLFWKFTIISTIVVAIFGSINIYLLWTSVYKSFEQEIDKRCKVLAEIVSKKALSPMVYDDKLMLYNILNDIRQSDSSITYIFLLNNTNKIVAQAYNMKIPFSLINVNSLDSGKYKIKVIKTKHFKSPIIRDIAYPIMKGEVGTVRLGIAEEDIQSEIRTATKNLLIMIIAFFIFGLIGAFLFSYIITTPIMRISQKAQLINLENIETEDIVIKKCTYSIFRNIQINDEMDILITKFSEMIQRLKNNYKKLKHTQNALIQAEKLASLGTFSAGIAHEINNPISGINNCINRIIKNPDNFEQNTKYIKLIQDATGKIQTVVQHLLDYSRKHDLSLKKIALNLVIKDAIELTKHKLNSNSINLPVKCNDNFFINGSANHLEQVFVNLILNSIDAINEKKDLKAEFNGRINIFAEKVTNKVIISLSDNGTGIPKDIQDKIFDPFFTSKKVGNGTGLGLSVSFNIINELGGNINVKSEINKGTKFIIELPCYMQ